MIVPQPRDKGVGEERVRKTGSQVSYWSGQVGFRGVGREITALPLAALGRKGWLWPPCTAKAAAQYGTESILLRPQTSRKILPLVLSPRFHPRDAARK